MPNCFGRLLLEQDERYLRSLSRAPNGSWAFSNTEAMGSRSTNGLLRADTVAAENLKSSRRDSIAPLARLDVGDAFGGGELLQTAADVPEHLCVRARTALKLYTISAAALQRRCDARLQQQLSNEVRM